MTDYTVILIAVLLAAVLVLVIGLLFKQKNGSSRDQQIELLQQQLRLTGEQHDRRMEQFQAGLDQLQGRMQQTLDGTRKDVGERLDHTARIMQSVNRQLGELGESSRHIFALGKDISKLQESLSAPKFRGQMGELFLRDLLAQIMPSDHYHLQYGFKGGQAVDAVIELKAGMVPVDAKFPLENFMRIQEADEETRKKARREFVRDVKKHIDAIASKYIRTDEGTFDFALMYIPAENVYYESIIRNEDDGTQPLFEYALNHRVIPVSPNSFYAYLQTILLGLRGLRIEESAREMIDHLARLGKEFEKFSESFRLVGTHLDRSSRQYSEAEKRFGRIETKMDQIQGHGHEPAALAPESESSA